MKRFTLLLMVAVFLTATMRARVSASNVPNLITHQGRLLTAQGAPVNGTVNLDFRIYSVPSGGTPLWQETQTVTLIDGLYSVLLGSVNSTPDFQSVFAGPPDSERYLGIKVGSDAELIPRFRLGMVPYAMRAGTVDGATGGTINGDLTVTQTIHAAVLDAAQTLALSVLGQTVAQCNSSGVGIGEPANANVKLNINPGPNACAVGMGETNRKWCFTIRATDDAMEVGKASNDFATRDAILRINRTNSRPTLTFVQPAGGQARIETEVNDGQLVLAGGPAVDNDDAEVVFCGGSHATTPGALIAYTGGVERWRLLNTGNWGIGKTNPAYKLDVAGQVNANELCIGGDCRNAWPSLTGNFVNLQATSPGTQQTGHLNISGTGKFGGLEVTGSSALATGTYSGTVTIAGVCNMNGRAVVSTPSTIAVNLSVKGIAGQTANLVECKDETDNVIASVGPTGTFSGNGSGLTNLNADNLGIGTVAVARGGTGAATAANARTNLGCAGLSDANTFTTTQTVQTGGDANIGMIVRANSPTQSASLQQWRNSAGTSMADILPDGKCVADGFYATVGCTTPGDRAASRAIFCCGAPSVTGLVVKGASAQTADLWQCQDNTGTVKASCDAAGSLHCNAMNATSCDVATTCSVEGTCTLSGSTTCNGTWTSNNTCNYNNPCTWASGATCTYNSPQQCNNSWSCQPTTDVVSATVRQTTAASPSSPIFLVANSNGASQYLRVHNNGRVAIGTSTPNAQCHIAASDGNLWVCENPTAALDQKKWCFQVSAVDGSCALATADDAFSTLTPAWSLGRNGTCTVYARFIDKAGEVNTGAAGPALTLRGGDHGGAGCAMVLNNATADGQVLGNLLVNGNLCATGTIGPCSDLRYKTNVKTVSRALEKVLNLRGVNFNWKREEFPEMRFPEGNQIGFIAQELKNVLPEAVSQDKDGYYMVDYGRVTPLLVEAVKEQQKTIENLNEKVETLQKAVEKLMGEKMAQH